mmetsp:Transcript_136161/g.261558  ORF Transcript_136161/g.261558 Transcript_136161/m.261558 type:complete len:460 (-) Transcript_136161:193-1572(-)
MSVNNLEGCNSGKHLHAPLARQQQEATKEVTVLGDLSSVRFRVPKSWALTELLGSGSYGVVAAFRASGQEFAVKKVEGVLDEPLLALRTLREVRLLSQLQHPNVLSILDVYIEAPGFRDAYICLELMDGDLAQLICPGHKPLADEQVRSISRQVLCGLLCLHSAHVIHRDLKPGNILVKISGEVKIGDLGLARSIHNVCDDLSSGEEAALTEYVVTRHYRAPEVTLTPMWYTYAVDIWSVGCVFGEIWEQRPLFNGKDSVDQIRKIILAMGRMSPDDTDWIPRHSAGWKFFERCTSSLRRSHFFWPDIKPSATDLLAQLLRFKPGRRPTAEEALRHAYFEESGETMADRVEVVAARSTPPVDWAFDQKLRYDEDGQMKPFHTGHFREAMLWAFGSCRTRSRRWSRRGRSAPARKEEHKWSEQQHRASSKSGSSGGQKSRRSASQIRGMPIAAVRKMVHL